MLQAQPNKPFLPTATVKAPAPPEGRPSAAADSLPLVVTAGRCNLGRPARRQNSRALYGSSRMIPSIRPATEDDFSQICSVLEELDTIHREALPHVFRRPGGPPRSADDLRKMASDTAVLIVAELEAKVVGVANAYLLDTPERFVFRARRTAVVDNVVVAKRFRRAGIATLLLRNLESWAESLDAHAVELNVWSFNEAATAFYRSLGYSTIRERLAKDCRDRRITGD